MHRYDLALDAVVDPVPPLLNPLMGHGAPIVRAAGGGTAHDREPGPLRLRALVHGRASQLCLLTLDRGSLARQARTRPLRSGQRVKPHAIKQRRSLRMMLGVPVVRAGRTQMRRLNIWHCLSLRVRNAKSRTSR